MDFSIIFERWELFLQGVLVTLEMTALSLLCGGILAVILSLLVVYGPKSIARAIGVYTYVFRGSPLLIQLFLIYYGLGQFEAVRESWVWHFLREPYWCVLLAFSLNTAAYTTEILVGSIKATPKGEIEACLSYGMTRGQTIYRVILPSAFRRSFPAYSNEIIFVMHSCSLASVVTLMDILGVARQVNSETYTAFPSFITAAVLYTAITLLLVQIFRRIEKRYFAHLVK